MSSAAVGATTTSSSIQRMPGISLASKVAKRISLRTAYHDKAEMHSRKLAYDSQILSQEPENNDVALVAGAKIVTLYSESTLGNGVLSTIRY